MDFDDLLDGHRAHVPVDHPDVLETWQRRFEHILVDEYQDTNPVQNELVLLLASGPPATCASSAMPTSRSTASARPTSATSSSSRRRSPTPRPSCSSRTTARPRTILDAANAVIDNNAGRKPKHLWTEQGPGEAIVRYHAEDEGDESRLGRARAEPACTTASTTAGARWRSSTAPTPRAA